MEVVLGVASVVLGGVAVALSVTLYKWSSDANARSERLSAEIQQSVSQLESTVDILHGDAWRVLENTMSDMRSALWPASGQAQSTQSLDLRIAGEADRRVRSILDEISLQIRGLISPTKRGDTAQLEAELPGLMNEAVERSRAAEEAVRLDALHSLLQAEIMRRDTGDGVDASAVVSTAIPDFPFSRVIMALSDLRERGLVDWAGESVRPDTIIRRRR